MKRNTMTFLPWVSQMADRRTLKRIHDIFSLFPDGCIREFTGDTDCLNIKIDCEYLSELTKQKYSFFYVELSQIHKLELTLWTDPSELHPVHLIEIKDIFEKRLGIVTTRLKTDYVEIVCHQESKEAILSLASEYICVFDQRMNEITVDQLRKICRVVSDNF